MKKVVKVVLDVLFLVGLVGLTVYYSLKGEDFNEIIEAIRAAKEWWLILAIALVFIFICGESVIMKGLYKILGTKIPLLRCIKYSFIGFFYSCVTPSATGGQPMQLFYMKKDRYAFSESCLVLLIITIGYKAALVFMSGALFLFQGSFILSHLDSVVYIFIYGIIVNVLFIAILFVVVFHETLAVKLMEGVVRLLCKLRLLKNKDRFINRISLRMAPYRDGAEYLKEHKLVFFNVLIISIIQRTALFLVTWCVYRTFNLTGINVVQIVALQTIIALSVDMLPLPGGVGASEKSFTIMFATIFGEALVLPGMMLSRGISYYFLVFVTGIVTVIAHFLMIIRERRS